MQRRLLLARIAGITAAGLLGAAAWAASQLAGAVAPAAAAAATEAAPTTRDGEFELARLVPGLPPAAALQHAAPELGLTATQLDAIRDCFERARPALAQLHSQMLANAELLASTRPDDVTYTSIVANVGQSAGEIALQLVLAGSQLRSQVFGVLTPAQRVRLVQLQARNGSWLTTGRVQARTAADAPAAWAAN